jgi:tetrahydromethanopterin S-methyltransferase subunit B
MRLLFKEAIQTCFNPPDDRLKKLTTWVENSKSARDPPNPNLEAYPNQFDKAEELITFYTFAPLVLSLNRIGLTNRILSLAKVSAYEESVEGSGALILVLWRFHTQAHVSTPKLQLPMLDSSRNRQRAAGTLSRPQ